MRGPMPSQMQQCADQGSPAAWTRVVHPLLTVREAAPGQPHAGDRRDGRQGIVRQLQHERDQGRRRRWSPAAATPCTLGLVGRKGTEFFARRGFKVEFEQVGIFQRLDFTNAQTIAQLAMDAFTSGRVDRVLLIYNEFKSVISQKVVVDQLLPIPRSEVDGREHEAATASARWRLSLRAVGAGDLQPAAAALRRSAGVPGAARVQRGVLRRADDGDGHGHAELRGHDCEPDALHEQGPSGRDHARDHRSGVRRAGAVDSVPRLEKSERQKFRMRRV